MKNLKRKMCMVLVFLVLTVAMAPAVMAADDDSEGSSLWDDIKSAGAGLYQDVKDKAPGWWESIKGAAADAAEAIKENGPGWVESAKDKGSELVDKGKDALQNAGEQASDFLEGQQDEFWERTEQQIYGSGSSGSGTTGGSSEGSGVSDESGGLGAQQDEFWQNVEQIMSSDPEATPPPEVEVPEVAGIDSANGAAADDATVDEVSEGSAAAEDAAPTDDLVAEDVNVVPLKNNSATHISVRPADEVELAAGDEANPPTEGADRPEGLETATKKSVEVPPAAIPLLVLTACLLLWLAHFPRKRDKH